MAKQIDGEKLIKAIRDMMTDEKGVEARAVRDSDIKLPPAFPGKPQPSLAADRKPFEAVDEPEGANKPGRITAEQLERIYRMFKARLLDELPSDPIMLQLLASQPEIILELQPRQVVIDGSSVRGRVARLIHAGFFDSGKRQGECRTELARTGSDPNSGQLSTMFGEFVRDGFLEKTSGDRYVKAPGLKISEKRLEAL